jgi:hypothetical protein
MIKGKELILTLSLSAASHLEHKEHPKQFANKEEPVSTVELDQKDIVFKKKAFP